jgi:hypothetical protein
MTAPALVKSADLKRMADIALEKGVRVEIEIDGKIIRVAPDIPDNHKQTSVDRDVSYGGNSLSEWRARREGKSSGYSSRQEKAR